MIKNIISRLFEILGYKIIRTGREKERLLSEFSQKGALYRRSIGNTEIRTVIDVGASNGCWSKMCMEFFPDCSYFLVEAQTDHEPALKKFVRKNINAYYIIAAAGDNEGELYFDNASLFGGTASHAPFRGSNIVVKATMIDTIVKQFCLVPPYLIKLDTHGFEIPILEGAAETLKKTNLLVIEAYNYQITENSLRFFELCRYMEEKGFLPIDVSDLIRRKKDHSFWQMDISFIRKESPEFKDNVYD